MIEHRSSFPPEQPKISKPLFMVDGFKTSTFPHEEGKVTAVEYIDSLPPSLLEKVPELARNIKPEQKYVLKEYVNYRDRMAKGRDIKRFSIEDITNISKRERKKMAIYDSSFEDLVDKSELSLVDRYRILQFRQAAVRQYFAELPDFVVTSHYFISPYELSVDSDDSSHEARIYELQEKQEGYFEIGKASEQLDFFKNMTAEQRLVLKKELLILLKNLEELLTEKHDLIFKNWVPDLHDKNIIITADGHVRTFDTNIFVFKDDDSAFENFQFNVGVTKAAAERVLIILESLGK